MRAGAFGALHHFGFFGIRPNKQRLWPSRKRALLPMALLNEAILPGESGVVTTRLGGSALSPVQTGRTDVIMAICRGNCSCTTCRFWLAEGDLKQCPRSGRPPGIHEGPGPQRPIRLAGGNATFTLRQVEPNPPLSHGFAPRQYPAPHRAIESPCSHQEDQ